MKKTVVILSVIVVLVFAVLWFAPLFFKGKVVRLIERQVAVRMESELHVGTMELSMFRSFPDCHVELKEVTIAREHAGVEDTLLYVPYIEASMNWKSLLAGNRLVIGRMLLRDGSLRLKVDAGGRRNWDIFPRMEKSSPGLPEQGRRNRILEWNDLSVGNLQVTYADYHTSTYAGIERADMQLAGNFSEDNNVFELSVLLNGISYRTQNTSWINRTDVSWQALITGNGGRKSFHVAKNDLSINDLQLDLTGSLAVEDTHWRVDLGLNAPDNRFESLLSLLPRHWAEKLEGWESGGDFGLEATVKGEVGGGRCPAFHAGLSVGDAFLKHPELPEALRHIRFDLQIDNPGGHTDSTRFLLRKASFDLAGAPFELFLDVTNPGQPLLEGGLKGHIDLAALERVFPLQEMELRGTLGADVRFQGEYRYIEKEQYDRFIAVGNITLRDFLWVSPRFAQGLSVPRANLAVTPSFLKLEHLQGKIHSSDFALQGRIYDYLPYLLRNGTLRGDFTLNSRLLNLNEFILAGKRGAARPKGGEPGGAEGVLEVPRHVDVRLATTVRTLLLDRLRVENLTGKVRLADAVATLDHLHMDLLQGKMSLGGRYSTADPQKPTVDFDIDASGFDLQSAYRAFTFVRKSLPVAAYCDGRISAAMNFAAVLDDKMSPLMHTADGRGTLLSEGIVIHDNPAMRQLAAVFKNDALNRLDISALKIDFVMKDGNITVPPFRTSLAGNPVTFHGNQSVEGALDYDLSLTLQRQFFGKEVDKLLRAIPGADGIRQMELDAHIGGTLANPVITPDLSKAVKAVAKEAEKALKGNLLQGLEKFFKKK